MKRLFFTPLIIFSFILQVVLNNTLLGQEVRVLTYDEAIAIALKESYTVKSYREQMVATEHYFNYYKAMFKPKLDFNIDTPSWNENVIDVQRANDLPVYNSYGKMRFGSDLKFTYILPTGGNFALKSQLYREDLKTVLALKNYEQLKNRQAYSSLSLSFNQPIFTRNTLQENLEMAKYSYEKSSSEFTRGQIDIIYRVTESFYALYRATREVEIAQEKLKNSEDAYRIAKLKGESGRIPKGDVLIAEIEVSRNMANLSEKEGNLERADDKFKQLIGLDLTEDIQLITDLKYDTFKVDLNKAIEEALKHRLEIYESELDIKLQGINVDKARRKREFSGNISAYYDLTGVSTLGAGSIHSLFESSFNNLVDRPPNRGITLTLSYPIFDWGRGSAKVQQGMASLRDAELSLGNKKVDIVREVRDIVRSVEEAKNRLQINEKNQQINQQSYEISRLRFENGNITSQELGIEQERLASTQLDYLNAFIAYQLAVADLKRKTLWDFENNRSYLKTDYLQGEE